MFSIGVVFLSAYSQSDLFGKFIFICLFLLSAISWTVLIYKIGEARRLKALCSTFQKKVEKEESFLNATLEKEEKESPFSLIYSILKTKTLEILKKNSFLAKNVSLSRADIELIYASVEVAISTQIKKLEKNLFILSTVVTLSPFMGLLGTVWGISLTFSNLETHTLSSTNSAVLSGLSLALATTVLGLLVAIPALISYNYLKSSVKDFTTDMENFSQNLITAVEIQYRKIE